VDLTVASSGRAITIDRARKARIRRDAVLHAIGAPGGVRRLVVAGVTAGVVGLAVRGWSAAALMVVVGAFAQVAWWWVRTDAGMRAGLDVGQTVRVDYASSGEICVTDSTGRTWLPRGSALAVLRHRGNVTVVGREIGFILPGELLTEADIAFLEGHGPLPEDVTAPGPDLPLSCDVSLDVQRRVVSAATRLVVRSADFLVPWFVAPFLIGIAAYVGSAAAVAITSLFCALTVLPGLLGLRRTRQRIRATYPVGLTLRAGVTTERLLLALKHGTRTLTWREYRELRLTKDVVLLHRAHRPLVADTTTVVPIALFDADALTTMSTVITGRF
jgi:hypothetical protein